MYFIPLPGELIRKIYGYVNPIFDYCHYRKAITDNIKEELLLKNLLENRNKSQDINDKIEYNDILTTHMLFMNTNQKIISDFVRINPLFKRPYTPDKLSEYHHKTAYENDYRKEQIIRMEHNIWIRRGLWVNIHNKNIKNALIKHDIVYILKHGSLDEIKIAFMINGISIKTPHFNYFFTSNSKIKEIRNSLVRKLIKL